MIDGSLVFGLRERLEASGRDHLCLFDLETDDGIGDAALLIVRLRAGDPLLLDLLVDDHPGLRPANAAIFLRGETPPRAVRHYLRRLHRLPDAPDGRRILLRIWVPTALRAMVPTLRRTRDLVAVLFGTIIDGIAYRHPVGDDWMSLAPAAPVDRARPLPADAALMQRRAVSGRAGRALGFGRRAEAHIHRGNPELVPAMQAIDRRRRYAHARRVDAVDVEAVATRRTCRR